MLSFTGGITQAAPLAANPPGLGPAAFFSGLGKAGVTNTGNAVLFGNGSADSSITGFPPDASSKKSSKKNALLLNDNVTLVEVDINVCNGVIHVIDQRLTLADLHRSETAQMTELTATAKVTIEIPNAAVSLKAPPVLCQAGKSSADILRAKARFSSFSGVLETVGLMDKFDQNATFTVFSPPNDGFISPTTALAAPVLGLNGEKITICHATGSSTNPYTEITIDSNGLSGHENHQNDVIPAPAGGCPAN